MAHEELEKAAGFLATAKGFLTASGIAGIGAGINRALSVKGLHTRMAAIEAKHDADALKSEEFRQKVVGDMGELKGMVKILVDDRKSSE